MKKIKILLLGIVSVFLLLGTAFAMEAAPPTERPLKKSAGNTCWIMMQHTSWAKNLPPIILLPVWRQSTRQKKWRP